MKQNKSFLSRLLFPAVLVTMVFSFTACGNHDINNGNTDVNSNAFSAAVPTATTEVLYSYFNDSVFVGDSVSLKLNLYVSAQRKNNKNFMGNAQFLTPGSYGSGNELKELGTNNTVHPSYNGTEMYLADAIKATGAKKVFIMLGINDIAVYGNNSAVKNMETVLAQIKEKNPNTTIYVQSVTPIVGAAQTGSFTNENLNRYNAGLKAMCEQHGYAYLDVASVMKDDEGNLKREYCSDPDHMGVHFTDEGCSVWIEYLRTHIS